MKKTAKKIRVAITSSAVVGSLLLAGVASAQTTATPTTAGEHQGFGRGGEGHAPGIFGTVASVSGNAITVTSKGFGKSSSTATPTTYTVDASSATVTKTGAASSVSAITVGDTVMVEGTVSGTSVKATAVRDGIPQGMGRGDGERGGIASSTNPGAQIQGNGEPVVGGTVTAVSGSAITITNKSNVTYTIDATSAKVTKQGATSTVSSVVVGDAIVVQGTVNGNAVTATSVIDQGVRSAATSTNTANSDTPGQGKGFIGGILGGIGGFFHSLFGFF